MRYHGISVLVAWAAQGHAELCSQTILSAARLGDVTQLSLSLEHELPTCLWMQLENAFGWAQLRALRGVNHKESHQNHQIPHSLLMFVCFGAGRFLCAGQLSTASHLLQVGAMMSIENMGRVPLHFAAAAGHLSTAQLLLNAKASKAYLELEDATQRTALHHARWPCGGWTRDLASIQWMVPAAHHFITHPAAMNSSIWHCCCRTGVLTLSSKMSSAFGHCTTLAPLARHSLPWNMKLMDLGADVWAVDRSRRSPITHAAAQENLDFAGELVGRLCSLHSQTHPGLLYWARETLEAFQPGFWLPWLSYC